MAVVVSHRLALAKMADRIVVLEHGKIVEVGNHDELMPGAITTTPCLPVKLVAISGTPLKASIYRVESKIQV
jgi:ABC-type glutathione transport system ATPase component